MAKFKKDQAVRYIGDSPAMVEFFGKEDMVVLDSIAPGLPIGNGETNNASEPIYRLSSKYGTILFLESELEVSQN